MKKLTTVLSKNQKLNSFNLGSQITSKFEFKVNLDRELIRHERREQIAAKNAFIEENLPYLEAFKEAQDVSVYL